MGKTQKKRTVIILGAGLAGLASGYELAKKGFKVIILEKQSRIGGLAQTININGFHFDTGPHRWYTKNNAVNKWMLKLLGNEIIKVSRLTRIYFDHKFFYYPIRIKNALSGIGLRKTLFAIYDYFIARLQVKLLRPKLLTMEDGYISQFGKTLYEIFFKRYSEKLWGDDCKKISVDWVGQRTRGLNILTVISDALFKNKQVVSLVDQFSYPAKGIGRIAEKLAAGIQKHKGLIILQAEVIEINHTHNRINSITVKLKGKRKSFLGDYFISSIPLNELIFRLQPRFSGQIIQFAKQLRFRDELQAALFVNKKHVTPDTWLYIHPKEIPFMRVMEMDNWSDKLSPKGTTTLVFEIACNKDDDIWNKSDQEVINFVTQSYINEFHLINKTDIIGGYVHRIEKEYPVYHLGYKEDVDKIKKFLKKYHNLQIIGRNGTFRYNNMDHSIEMGLYAAWNLIHGKKLYDIESVNIEREYLEEKKLENPDDNTLERQD